MLTFRRKAKRVGIGLLLAVFIPFLGLNSFFFLGSRRGMSDWSQIEQTAKAALSAPLTQADTELSQILNQADLQPVLKEYKETYRSKGEEYDQRVTQRPWKEAMTSMARLEQEKLHHLFSSGPISLSRVGMVNDFSNEDSLHWLLSAHSRLGTHLLETEQAERGLLVLEDSLSLLSHSDAAEHLFSLEGRLGLLTDLNLWVRNTIHTTRLSESTLLELEKLWSQVPAFPADIVVRACDNYFAVLRKIFDKASPWWKFSPKSPDFYFPGHHDYVWRRNLSLYLTFRSNLRDYYQLLSVEKPYNRQLERMGTCWFPRGRPQSWMTPKLCTNGNLAVLRSLGQLRATQIALQLEVYRLRKGHYPESLAELESMGFTVPKDPFNEKGFEYTKDTKYGSFELASRSNWHEQGLTSYHTPHPHKNQEEKPPEPPAANP